MIHLRQNDHEPPIGWCYAPFDDQPNFVVRAGSRQGLIRDVVQVFVANERTVPERLPELIEEWICRRIHESFCAGDEATASGAKRWPNPDFSTITTQTGAVLRLLRVNAETVNAEEADRRAAICAECQENVSAGGCAGCNGLRDWVSSNVPELKSNTRRLYVCRRSAVLAQAQVYLSNAALDHIAPQQNFTDAPATCWRKPPEPAPSQPEVPNG